MTNHKPCRTNYKNMHHKQNFNKGIHQFNFCEKSALRLGYYVSEVVYVWHVPFYTTIHFNKIKMSYLSLLSSCLSIWPWRCCLSLKVLWHTVQLYGFSPVWVKICLRTLPVFADVYEQYGHLCLLIT